ncbi:MAG: hypothetical protein ACFFG0_15545 [Candidatus Thorarchaeota archaeon]
MKPLLSQKNVIPSKSYIRIDSKIGTFILHYNGKDIDIGDYLEVRFTGEFDFKEYELKDVNRKYVSCFHEIELCFSAIHNENNILKTKFVSSSDKVNCYIAYNLHKNEMVSMSLERKHSNKYTWFWPKFNGESIGISV